MLHLSENEENQETHPLENSRWEETINKGKEQISFVQNIEQFRFIS